MADDPRRAALIAASNAAADAAGIPRLLLLACGIAESGLNPDARRPANPADDERYWPDVSGGVWQQTVRWDPEYRGDGSYPGPAEVERILQLQYDPSRSARIAAANLLPKWRKYGPDMLATLCAYNWPAGDGKPSTAGVEQNYRRGLTEAAAILGDSSVPSGIKLSDVLARGRSRLNDPYVWGGKVPGSFDCSGFVSWTYNGQVPSFTDSIFGATQRVETPAPGDIVLYEYTDASQPGVRFPHVGLFLSDTATLDARFPMGVGEHEQLSRAKATRYYRRLPGVAVDTTAVPTPPPHVTYYQPGDVGTGLLAMMSEDGTEPAMPSVFLPLGRSPSLVEECQGLNGTIYRWHIPTGRSWAIRADTIRGGS